MEAAVQQMPLQVSCVTDRPGFMALSVEWDVLADSLGDSPFIRHAFFRVWIDNFAPQAPLKIFTVRHVGGELLGVLPLIEETVSFYGIPVTQWSAAANAHSCRFDVLTTDAHAVAPALWACVREVGGWDVLRMTDVPAGGAGWSLYRSAEGSGNPVGTWESLQSPFVPLAAKWELQQSALSSKFKSNLRRRRKKLEEKGQVTVECVVGGELLDAKLEEGFELEGSGWKGERGTAMAQDLKTRGFYTELARLCAAEGVLALYFLRLDGRAVAFQYGIRRGHNFYLLKPGYDEALKECSPGQLLVESVLEDCIAKGVTEFDFLGPDMTWKRDWTDQVRVHTWLYVFAKTRLGRALRATKFVWVPRAKETLARWKR